MAEEAGLLAWLLIELDSLGQQQLQKHRSDVLGGEEGQSLQCVFFVSPDQCDISTRLRLVVEGVTLSILMDFHYSPAVQYIKCRSL